MSQWHLETVTPAHLNILQEIVQFPDLILVGGTALALQIGHRKSYDLDWVIRENVTTELIDRFLKAISPKGLQQRLLSDTQYTAFADGIKVTIFQDGSPFLYETRIFEGAKLASIADIFSTKLYILGRRNAWRDYVDIACCLKNNLVDLKQGIHEAMQRYKVTQKWILEPLVYFDDIEMVPVEWVSQGMSEDEVKNILTTEVEKLIKEES
jgi:hypothetical protein